MVWPTLGSRTAKDQIRSDYMYDRSRQLHQLNKFGVVLGRQHIGNAVYDVIMRRQSGANNLEQIGL